MAGGITILLIIIVLIAAGIGAMVLSGSAGVAARGADRGGRRRGGRPRHTKVSDAPGEDRGEATDSP
jgi:hypothetical protein